VRWGLRQNASVDGVDQVGWGVLLRIMVYTPAMITDAATSPAITPRHGARRRATRTELRDAGLGPSVREPFSKARQSPLLPV